MKPLYIVLILFGIWYFLGDQKETPKSYYTESPTPTYDTYNRDYSRTLPSSNSSNGYPCTYDCSGHEAGYEWAEENGIDNPDDCDGNSDSFIEGCQSYAEEQMSNESEY